MALICTSVCTMTGSRVQWRVSRGVHVGVCTNSLASAQLYMYVLKGASG